MARKPNKARDSYLKKTYGITEAQYYDLLDTQHGCCAVCERPQSSFKIRLAVDHNHVTGEIRGLLCTYCNRRLVGRHRDPALLRKIADYITQGTGWIVPKKPKKRKRKR